MTILSIKYNDLANEIILQRLFYICKIYISKICQCLPSKPYLIYIQLTTIQIKLFVEILKHIDDHHWCCCSTDRGKSDYVTKQHCDIRICFRFDCLA